MDKILLDVLLALIAAAITWAGYVMAAKVSKTQAESSGKAVDAEAYTRAQTIYDAALETLRDQLRNVQAEVERLRASNDRLRESNDQLHASNYSLTREITALRREMETDRKARNNSGPHRQQS